LFFDAKKVTINMVSLTVTQKDCPETERAVHKWITCCCINRRLIQYTHVLKS